MDRREIIVFKDGDMDNPYNWSRTKKLWMISIGTLAVLNTTIASSLPSLASLQLQRHFNVSLEQQLILPNSCYLMGYILGGVFWAPMSEHFGRRWNMIGAFFFYMIFMMACAVAPTWAAFNVFRFLTGFCGASSLSLVGGLFAEILKDPIWRGRAIAWFMTVASAGPALGPVPSAYFAELSWRWPFWFGLIAAGICLLPIATLPETFAPVLLQVKARQLRKEELDRNIYASLELKQSTLRQLVAQVLGRPMRMMLTEPIISACCLYLSLIYAVIFMLFQAYDVIFPPIYGFHQGTIGLAFLPIVVGCFIAMPIVLWYDKFLRNAKAREKPWSSRQEYQRLPLALIGGPLLPIGMFWLGRGARRDVHYTVPMLGGLPFGIGFVLVFVTLYNYLVDSYQIYSASALGATSMARSMFGVVLPFATRPMYSALGTAWACSLLAFLSVAMCLIPVVFIRYGPVLRAKSSICQELAKARDQGLGTC